MREMIKIFPFPFVFLKTYNRLLQEYQSKEDHYWKQYAHNLKSRRISEENEKLKQEIEKLR